MQAGGQGFESLYLHSSVRALGKKVKYFLVKLQTFGVLLASLYLENFIQKYLVKLKINKTSEVVYRKIYAQKTKIVD